MQEASDLAWDLKPRYKELSKYLPKKKFYTKIKKGDEFPEVNVKNLIKTFYGKKSKECYEDLKDLILEKIPEKPNFNIEWEADNIRGSPDIVSEDGIYEIVSIESFTRVRTYSIILTMMYVSLARENGCDYKYVGLILPSQNKFERYDISDWDHLEFWENIKETISEKSDLYPKDQLHEQQMKVEMSTGYHIKKDNLLEMVRMLEGTLPFQFFINGRYDVNIFPPNDYRAKIEFLEFKKDLMRVIGKYHPELFIHSAYKFNLSNPFGIKKDLATYPSLEGVQKSYVVKKLVNVLEFAEETGVKGVVIHCGKRKKLTEDDAVNVMRVTINTILTHITKPVFYLETSSGQHGETLCSPCDLVDFYYSLGEPEKVKICVDTCHVFAAGYEPMEFINYLLDNDVPIGLIHYNDSQHPRGSMKDRHEMFGKGYVGAESLMNVLNWAIRSGVPMVREY